MSRIIAAKPKPPAVTGLTASMTVGGAVLNWNANPQSRIVNANTSRVPKLDTYQVFVNTIDDLATATQVADNLVDATYTYPLFQGAKTLSQGGGPFFWVRAKNEYGEIGPWSAVTATNIGAIFNTHYLGVVPMSFAALSLSIDNVQARVYYTTEAGAADTGLMNFTTPPVQGSSDDGVNWTNLANAIGDDGQLASVTLTEGQMAQFAMFTLADLGVPDDAIIDGVQIFLKGQTGNMNGLLFFACLVDSTMNGFLQEQYFSDFTVNDTPDVITAGGPTSMFGLTGAGPVTSVSVIADLTPRNVVPAGTLANETKSVVLNAFSYGQGKRSDSGFFTAAAGEVKSVGNVFSGGIGTSSPQVSLAPQAPLAAWSTWYGLYSSNAISASPAPTKVFTTVFCDVSWKDLVMTTGSASVELQVSLFNVTDNVDVATETFTLGRWGNAGQLELSNPIFNMTWLFENRGLTTIPSNKFLDVRARLRKLRSDAGTDVTVSFNRIMIETSYE